MRLDEEDDERDFGTVLQEIKTVLEAIADKSHGYAQLSALEMGYFFDMSRMLDYAAGLEKKLDSLQKELTLFRGSTYGRPL